MVSIIVPIYNVEAYLRDCIDSVLGQTFVDYELILVDDGSPDNCGAICDEYAVKDSRIRVIHKKNGGLSDARNVGLGAAQGKYIYFLDSDDTIEPQLLETVVPYMEQGYDLAAFTLRGFYDDGTVLPAWSRLDCSFSLNSEEERKQYIHKVQVQAGIGWEACSRIYVREIIEKYHLRFADNRKIFAEDMYFNLCYCAHIRKIISLNICLYNYRLRKDSIMRQQAGRNTVVQIHRLAQAVYDHYRGCEDCKLLTEDFSLLHFQILMAQFVYQLTHVSDYTAYRETVISSISDWEEVAAMLLSNLSDRKKLWAVYSPLKYIEVVHNAKFLLGGSAKTLKIINWMIQRIRNQKERLERIRRFFS